MSSPLWNEANREFFDSGVWRTVLDPEGRRICKYPTDLQVYREIIRRARPEVIVETGSAEGGSAAWFASFADVISIDIARPTELDEGVTWITGSSTDPDVVEQVFALVGGRRCLVSLDSDHHARHVEAEIAAYASLVSRDSYLVVEDTAVDVYGIESEMYPEGGPLVAVERFLASTEQFTPDRRCERFKLGMNPGGWLRRL